MGKINEERKESLKVVGAFLSGKPAKAARSHTDGQGLYLHGHKIAWHGDEGKIHATLAGWGTKTTRDRLNTLTRAVHGASHFHQKGGVQHYKGNPIDSKDVVQIRETSMVDEVLKVLNKKTNWTEPYDVLDESFPGNRTAIDAAFKKIDDLGKKDYKTPLAKAREADPKFQEWKKNRQAVKEAIHIKPSHKGLLHKDLGVGAGKKISAKAEEKAKHSSDPAVRKRATFALNARKWHHEEVQLDELSKKTLGSYVKKAAKSYGNNQEIWSGTGSFKSHQKAFRKMVGRGKGISRAVDRLQKEEVLDEIGDTSKGKKVLASYINKAHRSGSTADFVVGKNYGKELATKKRNHLDMSSSGINAKISDKRTKGIERATARLTKEEKIEKLYELFGFFEKKKPAAAAKKKPAAKSNQYKPMIKAAPNKKKEKVNDLRKTFGKAPLKKGERLLKNRAPVAGKNRRKFGGSLVVHEEKGNPFVSSKNWKKKIKKLSPTERFLKMRTDKKGKDKKGDK